MGVAEEQQRHQARCAGTEVITLAAGVGQHDVRLLPGGVNKWTLLARDRGGARTLAEATHGDLKESPRYRETFRQPIGPSGFFTA